MCDSIKVEDVSKTIRYHFAEILEIDEMLLENGEKKLADVSDFDSIHILDMVTAIEKAFNISIQEDDFPKMDTVNAVVDMVISKKKVVAS